MHVIVVGCGRLGSELAIELDRQGHSVAIIDKNRNSFRRYLPERWSGRAVLGFGFDRDALEQADIKTAATASAVLMSACSRASRSKPKPSTARPLQRSGR